MRIADIYDPTLPSGESAEDYIMSNDLKDLYDEIRRMIFDTKLVVSPLKTTSGRSGKAGITASVKLAESLNDAFKTALESAKWEPLVAPGATAANSTVDWFKAKPTGRSYGAEKAGIGMEIQMGNNYQFNEDIKRLTEAYLAGFTVAGVSIVASDSLAQHKADRGAFFSDARNKLNRHLESLSGARARRFPPIVIIGIEQDGYNGDPYGYFELQPVKLTYDARRILHSKPNKLITNGNDATIRKRRAEKRVV